MSVFTPMTWKTYAVMSGAGVLATWFAAATPSSIPVNVAPAQPRAAAGVAAAASDIEQQAAHLQARLQQEAFYREPDRNLFRFGERRAARPARVQPIALPPAPSQPVAPPPPPLRLAGIAEDQDGTAMVRTAILSTPSGVVLAKVGDEVLGRFRLSKIDEDAAELVELSDGTLVRLALKR
jgi:hypothetical protein